jgi:hypothetical protein
MKKAAVKTALVAVSRKRAVDPAGRLDLLALRVFNRLLDAQGGPMLKACMKSIEPDITATFREALGPGSQAGRTAKRLVKALHESQGGQPCK